MSDAHDGSPHVYELTVTAPGGSRRHPLAAGSHYVIGRGADCDIVIDAPFVSRRHAELVPAGDGWTLRQLSATSPTLGRGRPVTEASLTPGESFEIIGPGGERVTFELERTAVERPAAKPSPAAPPPAAAEPAAPPPPPDSEQAALLVRHGGDTRRHPLDPASTYLIGRGADSDIAIDAQFVSRRQAEIVHAASGWTLRQIGVTNPTLRAGEAVTEVVLTPGEPLEIRGVGDELVTLEFEPAAAPASAAPSAPAMPETDAAEQEAREQSLYVWVEVSPNDLRVDAGTEAVFAVKIANQGEQAQSLSFEVHGLPPAWLTIDFDSGRKAFPREQLSGSLAVAVPKDAAADRLRFDLVAWAGAERSSAECWLEVLPATPGLEDLPALPPPRLALVPAELSVERGSGSDEDLSLIVRNESGDHASYALSVEGWTAGWYTIPETMEMAAGEVRDTKVAIRPPPDTKSGQYRFSVRVAHVEALEISGRVRGSLDIVDPPPPSLALEPAEIAVEEASGVEQRARVTLSNTGSAEREYTLEVDGLPLRWFDPPASVRVAPGQSIDTHLAVRPPRSAEAGEHDFTVRAAIADFPDIASEAAGRLVIRRAQPASARHEPARAGPAGAAHSVTPTTRPPDVSLVPTTTFRFGRGTGSRRALINIKNAARGRESYEIEVQGVPETWYTLVTSEVTLEAGASRQVPLQLQPSPDAQNPPGDYTFRVRVTPRGVPESATEITGVLALSGT